MEESMKVIAKMKNRYDIAEKMGHMIKVLQEKREEGFDNSKEISSINYSDDYVNWLKSKVGKHNVKIGKPYYCFGESFRYDFPDMSFSSDKLEKVITKHNDEFDELSFSSETDEENSKNNTNDNSKIGPHEWLIKNQIENLKGNEYSDWCGTYWINNYNSGGTNDVSMYCCNTINIIVSNDVEFSADDIKDFVNIECFSDLLEEEIKNEKARKAEESKAKASKAKTSKAKTNKTRTNKKK